MQLVSPNCDMDLPITVRLTKGLPEGGTLIIRGRPTSANAWFAISLLKDMQTLSNRYDNPTNVVAFQIQPRFDERLIVLNTFNRGWGTELRNPGFPLYPDVNNEIKIHCTANSYVVHLNGKHFANYPHRVSMKMANYLNIYGGLELREIIFL